MLGMFRKTSLTLLVNYVLRNVRFWTDCKKRVVVVVFIFFFPNFFEEEISNCTILCYRFVRSWHLFCVRNSYYVKNFITIQIQSCIKLECCVHTWLNCSGLDFCGRIKVCPVEHLVIIYIKKKIWYDCHWDNSSQD